MQTQRLAKTCDMKFIVVVFLIVLIKMETRIVIPFRELANVLKLNSNSIDSLISHVKIKHNLNNDEIEIVTVEISSFYKNFNKKLGKCSNSLSCLLKDPWMRKKIEVKLKKKDDLKRKIGRPTKVFEECAARTKRRKVQEMRDLNLILDNIHH